MSVKRMARVTVASAVEDVSAVLDVLQSHGCFHVTPVRSQVEVATPAREAREALRHLLATSSHRRPRQHADDFDADRVISAALHNRDQIIAVQAEIDRLEERRREVEPWGDFEFCPLEEMAGVRLWFYLLPKRERIAITLPHRRVYSDGRHDYVVVLSEQQPDDPALEAHRSRVGTRSLAELGRRLERRYDRREDLQAERVALTAWIELLTEHLAAIDDASARAQARSTAYTDEHVLVMQGWVPTGALADMTRAVSATGAAVVSRPPRNDEEPPVALEPPKGFAPGSDLLHFYQLPGYRDWDPSAFAYVSFALFFAIILADAAYSVIILGATLAFWSRFRDAAAVRFRQMLIAVGVLGTAYGIIAGSYFGWRPPADTFLSRLAILEVDQASTMMPLTLSLGVAHLTVANVAAGLRRRSWRSLSFFGWAATFSGGLAAYLGLGIGLPLLGVGLVAVLAFSSERRVEGGKSAALRILDGVVALTGVSRAFGDTLSYLRLFALGLASASLASTFNQLSANAAEGGGIGVVVALLLLVIGHGLNLVLGLVGGVVHGLRLNVIELYNWGVEGEGQAFTPLRRTRS